MKAFAITLIGTLFALGLVVGAEAQTSGPGSGTANPEAKPDNPTDRRNDPAPQPATPQRDSSTRVTVPGSADRPDVDVRSGRDDGAALPRQHPPETPGIVGLSSTFVALLAAALFIVAVLAVVAMNRRS